MHSNNSISQSDADRTVQTLAWSAPRLRVESIAEITRGGLDTALDCDNSGGLCEN